ncbi:MAG: glycosyl transferase family 36, partial [Geminicoccaceae bacterium]
ATLKSLTLGPDEFRAWSLQLFLGLLAYDWFRILIWFDHMGLRVATLVNLSFVGGDLADERAARWIGHSGRARCIPDGLRKFATWAPLLIPFYIPRGAEWDQVWGEAERMQSAAPSLLPPVQDVLIGYGLVIGVALLVAAVSRWRHGRSRASAPRAAAPPWAPSRRLVISNGDYTLELTADGRSFARCHRVGDQPPELDLTRRSDDRLQLGGKFVYLRCAPSGALWSLGWQPLRHAGPTFAVEQPTPTTLRLANDRDGVRAEAVIEVAAEESLETWRLRLVNETDEPRTVELVTYQELALAPWDSYRRTPSYNALFVGTCFVQALGAIIARNRHVKPQKGPHGDFPFAREVAFHAAAVAGAAGRLTGYQDARPCFLGMGTAAAPEVFETGRMRDVADEGLLYSFDPIASLRLEVELPARGSAEIMLVDGYAADERQAAAAIARHLSLQPLGPDRLAECFARSRMLDSTLRPPDVEGIPYRYAADGRELVISDVTPRPWAHMLANPLGHGALVQNDGEIFSFAGNAQQNGLTPFRLDTVSNQVPGSAVYILDLDDGRVDAPAWTPLRHRDASYETAFGLGYATQGMQRDGLELELTVFVPPDRPIEVRLLTIRNRTARSRRFRVVPYVEMALAENARDTRGRLQVRTDSFRKAYYFSNPSNDFRQGWALVVTSLAVEAQEHVRERFLGGPERDFTRPFFVEAGSGDASAEDDGRRVAAFCGTVEVPAHGEVSVAVTLGQAADLSTAERLAERHASLDVARDALADTKRFWTRMLGELRVETSLPAFDRLVNDWLPYQLLTARLWGRCGPNQRGGAFGFRDQLQDVLPLFAIRPDLARQQILLHARQQFLEGDVLQWWHPAATGGTGLAARNNASDPHLWL